MNISRKISAGLTIILSSSVLLIFFLSDKIIALKKYLPSCFFYEKTGYLCPACGNTRSITALLNRNIAESLGYNITPFVLLSLTVIFSIETAAGAFGIRLQIIPRKYSFIAILLSSMTLYFLLRNFLPFLTLCL